MDRNDSSFFLTFYAWAMRCLPLVSQSAGGRPRDAAAARRELSSEKQAARCRSALGQGRPSYCHWCQARCITVPVLMQLILPDQRVTSPTLPFPTVTEQ